MCVLRTASTSKHFDAVSSYAQCVHDMYEQLQRLARCVMLYIVMLCYASFVRTDASSVVALHKILCELLYD
jgi:hypothetical protein